MKKIGKTLRNIICGLGISIATAGSTTKANVSGWHEYNDHFYRITPEIMSWTDSEKYAVIQDGHLVTINDELEELWLISVFGPAQYWIGFYQLNPAQECEPNKCWEWISGEPITYLNWAMGEPDNSGVENWASMYNGNNPGWRDGANEPGILGIIESQIPEPSTLTLLVLGSSMLFYRKNK